MFQVVKRDGEIAEFDLQRFPMRFARHLRRKKSITVRT